jgi:hypothetical protein
MAFTIHKYVLDDTGEFSVEMPAGAKILRIGEQTRISACCEHGAEMRHAKPVVVLWAVVDLEAKKTKRSLLLTGTDWNGGGKIALAPYVDTVQMSNGLVLHLFDLGEKEA